MSDRMGTAKSSVLSAALLAATIAGCGGASKSFQVDGYQHEQYPMRVAAQAQGADGLLGGQWQLDNYQRDKKGKLVDRKKGDKYEGLLSFDLNDDGVADESAKYPRFEILLTNRHTDGEIWLSTVPLNGKNAEKDLVVLLERYVEAISGTGSVVVISMADAQKTAVADKRYATRVTELRKVLLDGIDGLAATVEVANVDQLQLSRDSRWARAKLVFLRPGFRYVLGTNSVGAATHSWPVLVVAGYSNSTGAFDSGLPDFERFLAGIDILSDDEVVGRYASAMVECVGGVSADVEFQIDGAGSVTGIPNNTKPCLRRIIASLRFSAQGTRRTYRATVTRNAPAAPGPQGYRPLEVIQSDSSDKPAQAPSQAP
jgi:hypothetical protein